MPLYKDDSDGFVQLPSLQIEVRFLHLLFESLGSTLFIVVSGDFVVCFSIQVKAPFLIQMILAVFGLFPSG